MLASLFLVESEAWLYTFETHFCVYIYIMELSKLFMNRNIMRILTQDILTVLWLVDGFELYYESHPNFFSEDALSWKLPPTLGH